MPAGSATRFSQERRPTPDAKSNPFSPPTPPPTMTAILSPTRSTSEEASLLNAGREAKGTSAPNRGKPYDETLRAQLAAYRDANVYSLKDLARQLQCSDATVSRYLSKKP